MEVRLSSLIFSVFSRPRQADLHQIRPLHGSHTRGRPARSSIRRWSTGSNPTVTGCESSLV